MRRFYMTLGVILLLSLLVSISLSQQAPTTSVPNLIRFSGIVKDTQGAPLTSATFGVTFTIYEQQDGGAARLLETQNVAPHSNGQYSFRRELPWPYSVLRSASGHGRHPLSGSFLLQLSSPSSSPTSQSKKLKGAQP